MKTDTGSVAAAAAAVVQGVHHSHHSQKMWGLVPWRMKGCVVGGI